MSARTDHTPQPVVLVTVFQESVDLAQALEAGLPKARRQRMEVVGYWHEARALAVAPAETRDRGRRLKRFIRQACRLTKGEEPPQTTPPRPPEPDAAVPTPTEALKLGQLILRELEQHLVTKVEGHIETAHQHAAHLEETIMERSRPGVAGPMMRALTRATARVRGLSHTLDMEVALGRTLRYDIALKLERGLVQSQSLALDREVDDILGRSRDLDRAMDRTFGQLTTGSLRGVFELLEANPQETIEAIGQARLALLALVQTLVLDREVAHAIHCAPLRSAPHMTYSLLMAQARSVALLLNAPS